MINVEKLKTRTAKELATLAKRNGVAGWHGMRKDELVRALSRIANRKTDAAPKKSAARNGSANGHSNGAKPSGNGKDAIAPAAAKTPAAANGKIDAVRDGKLLQEVNFRLVQSKDLAYRAGADNGSGRDRLVLMVRDPFWLQAYWELKRASIDRAQAALRQYWHAARPVLRLLEVVRDGTTNGVRKLVRDIEIHGQVNNWYVDVEAPPKSFQVEIGYLAPGERFLALARSNVVTTHAEGSTKSAERDWLGSEEECDKVFALSGGYREEQADLRELFEQRLRRPMGTSLAARFGQDVKNICTNHREFSFEVDAELVVFGVADPSAQVTLKGEPVKLQRDGTFAMRFSLPDRRQVLPIVASSHDGAEQRTIVLAVERNTKVMEPITRDSEP